jgi:hypothetical protein
LPQHKPSSWLDANGINKFHDAETIVRSSDQPENAQQLANGPYPQPYKFNPKTYYLFINILFNIIPTPTPVFPAASFVQTFLHTGLP